MMYLSDYIIMILILTVAVIFLDILVFIVLDCLFRKRKNKKRYPMAAPPPVNEHKVFGRRMRSAVAPVEGTNPIMSGYRYRCTHALDLNEFEYEIQNLLALRFGERYPLYFIKNGKKYKIVFDETERMVQEVFE